MKPILPGLVLVVSLAAAVAPVVHAQESRRRSPSDSRGDTRAPAVVVRGRSADVPGCGSCHLLNGLGRPDSARLAGLSAEYIAVQVANYQKGLRGVSSQGTGPVATMAAIARATNERDLRLAAEYFASTDVQPWVRVVEADAASPHPPSPDGSIVETLQTRPGADREGWPGVVAYVPQGAVKRGELLVTTGGGGRTVRCALCHGEDLRGAGTTPRLAGQLASYVARQLLNMQTGARHGMGPDLMMGTVARLTDDDVVAIAAYTASLAP